LRRTPREVIRAAIISARSRAVFFSFVIVGLVKIALFKVLRLQSMRFPAVQKITFAEMRAGVLK
jgi:hypothetical protein